MISNSIINVIIIINDTIAMIILNSIINTISTNDIVFNITIINHIMTVSVTIIIKEKHTIKL